MKKKPLRTRTGQAPMAGLEQAKARTRLAEQSRRKNRSAVLSAVMLGGFSLAAIFAYLQATKPQPPASEREEVEASAAWEERAGAGHAAVEPAAGTAGQAAAVSPKAVESAPPVAAPDSAPDDAGEPVATLDAESPLVLTGLDAGRAAALERDAALFRRVVEGRLWRPYRELLARSIRTAIDHLPEARGNRRFEAVWNEPALSRALLRWGVLGALPEASLAARVTDEYSSGFLRWLWNDDAAMEEFLLLIRPEDDADEVLRFLMDAWSVEEDAFADYHDLAFACAVVFDREIRIPHMIGEEPGAGDRVDALQRFLWFVRNDKAGKLAAPVRRSTARDLVWVVCAPVTTYELEWAVGHVHHNRKNWGNAYGKVEYLMERAVEGLDPYAEYSFAEILKEGGICGDQSYFCVNTARAQGIPAMVITGVTDLGSHAWAGIKVTDDEWSTDTGRIGGVSKGETGNPQTGATITEQEILQWNDRQQRSPAITLATWRHLWLAGFFAHAGDAGRRAAAVRIANKIGPAFPETWQALFALLQSETRDIGEPPVPANLGDWKTFAADMRREFKDNPRIAALAARAENEYILPHGEIGEARRAMQRERRRIERESPEQKDLIATSLRREADFLTRRGGPSAEQDIMRLYDSALREYGANITGFQIIATDYFSRFRSEPAQARKVARDIELAFKRSIETGDKNWFRANAESDLFRMICRFYREAGDPDRAAMLEKRIETLIRRAKRGAL